MSWTYLVRWNLINWELDKSLMEVADFDKYLIQSVAVLSLTESDRKYCES